MGRSQSKAGQKKASGVPNDAARNRAVVSAGAGKKMRFGRCDSTFAGPCESGRPAAGRLVHSTVAVPGPCVSAAPRVALAALLLIPPLRRTAMTRWFRPDVAVCTLVACCSLPSACRGGARHGAGRLDARPDDEGEAGRQRPGFARRQAGRLHRAPGRDGRRQERVSDAPPPGRRRRQPTRRSSRAATSPATIRSGRPTASGSPSSPPAPARRTCGSSGPTAARPSSCPT